MISFKVFPVPLLCLLALSCDAGPSTPVESATVKSTEPLAIATLMPTDSAARSLQLHRGRPTHLIKNMSTRVTRSSPDRVEILEGTYKTVGSRRFLLNLIANADAESKPALIAKYLAVVSTLPLADQAPATQELQRVAPTVTG